MRLVQMVQVERDLQLRHAWCDTYGHRLRHVRLQAGHLWGTYSHKRRTFYLRLTAYCTSSQL